MEDINLTSSLRNLNSAIKKAESPAEVLKLVRVARDNIFRNPEFQKEINLSGTLNIKLINKIKFAASRAYFDSVQVNKALPDALKNQREQIFWGLKDAWWKQIIDKPCHRFGSEVFDKALHGREAEPGFLQGIKDASLLAGKFIGRENSVALYKAIHHAACQHFEVKENDKDSVLVSGKDTGQFTRLSNHSASFTPSKYDPELDYLLTFQKLYLHADEYSPIGIAKMETSFPGIYKDSSDKAMIEKNELRLKNKIEEWKNRVDFINSEIRSISKEIGLKEPYAIVIWDGENSIKLKYTLPQDQLENAVERLFERFNQKAAHLQNELKNNLEIASYEDLPLVQTQYEAAIRKNIAELFQHLEWLHPFADGQGRTDLIFLAKLLTDYGLHPAILEQPYDSSIYPLAEWDEKLAIGLKNWEREQQAISSPEVK